MRRLSRLTALRVMVTALVAACSGSPAAGPTGSMTATPAPAPIVYAAVGASETVGVGALNPTRDAWPQVLFRRHLPRSAVFYNFGIPGATVQSALTDELPNALSVEPTLVTVWLDVNDLLASVSASDYETRLDQLVHALSRGGATRVLVANTPYLDRLPAYVECRAGAPAPGVTCPPQALISPEALNAAVDAFDAAIARVVQREGAVLVDLHAMGEVPDKHPEWVSGDGFHPSTSGHAEIASAFAAALNR